MTSYKNWKVKERRRPMTPAECGMHTRKSILYRWWDRRLGFWSKEAELSADLVSKRRKNANSLSLRPLRSKRTEPPQKGPLVLFEQPRSSCALLKITKVPVQPFHQKCQPTMPIKKAKDKSLAYWRQVHEDFFTDWLGEAGLTFTPDMQVV